MPRSGARGRGRRKELARRLLALTCKVHDQRPRSWPEVTRKHRTSKAGSPAAGRQALGIDRQGARPASPVGAGDHAEAQVVEGRLAGGRRVGGATTAEDAGVLDELGQRAVELDGRPGVAVVVGECAKVVDGDLAV